MATSRLARQYAEANAALVAHARADLRALLTGNYGDEQGAQLYAALVRSHGSSAATLAAEFYDDARREAGVTKVFRARLADPPTAQETDKTWGWAQSDPTKTSARLDSELQRLVLQAGRDTIADSAEADPVKPGWARVPKGKTCAFCTTLAGRGIIYKSKTSALHRKDGRKFHPGCDCIAEPAFSDDDLSIDIQPYLDLYTQARKDAGSADLKDILAAMRRIPGAVTDGAKLEDGADRVDWPARQKALGIDTHGEVLEPHEIEFVERFTTLGHELEWIPRDRKTFRPTNDLRWLNNGGIQVEVKSTFPKYKTIRNEIAPAVARARAQGVVKENFIIDLGDRELTGKLRAQLSQYNARNPMNRIARLWVMARGALYEIALV